MVHGSRIRSAPLISKKTLKKLGMIQIQPDGSLGEKNDLRIPTENIKIIGKEKNVKSDVRKITNRCQKVFEGIGKIEDKKNGNEIYGKFCMKPEKVPVAQKPIPVPLYLQKPLKMWLEQCNEEDIFEKVPPGEPVTWCSPLVVQPKPRISEPPREKLGPNMIQASVDLRVPNKFMERSRITHGSIIEEFIHKFHDCQVFSKLGMRQGYHQLLLHPESRQVAIFCTPWGNMRPKRLIFGVKASQDLFDETIYRIFSDIPKCFNQRDDILIGGKNMEEHNRTLEMVSQRALDYGITFNLGKCQFGMDELEFYGYRFTKDGLKPSPDKIRAVKDCNPPESIEAVRSFLGMTGYLSKFIPRYSNLTAPLRELT